MPLNGEGIERILSFTSGQPAALEKRFGRGRVVLWATSADADWNNFPSQVGVMALHQVLQYLTPDTRWRFNRLVNSETSIPVSASYLSANYRLERPDGAIEDKQAEPLGDGRVGLVIGGLSRRGIYQLKRNDGVDHELAVNVDLRESDLSHLSQEELRAAFGEAPVVLTTGLEGLQSEIKQQQAAGGWARNLLIATLALVLLETFLAWYFNGNS